MAPPGVPHEAPTAEAATVAWHNLVKKREGFGDERRLTPPDEPPA